jgi:subtilisin-like proprotein convertase family protein
VREYSSSEGASIPDGLGTGVPGAAASTTINVGDSGTIADVNVTLDIAHTWTGDLIVTVSHGPTTVTVINRIGVPATAFGCADDNFSGTVLDDEAGSSIQGVCTPGFPGSYIPAEALSAFDGMEKNGDWTLSVTDNAAADTGSILGWGLTIDNGGGEPTCTPVECFLVVGSGPGASGFVGAEHWFDTQVGPAVEDSYAVLMEDIPSFVLPPLTRQVRGAGHGTIGWQPLADTGSPNWMVDGEFAVQVIMWNPVVFPSQPEQFTGGLHVEIAPNGSVSTTPYGDDVGGLSIWAEITHNGAGQRVISFPFLIPGM